MLSEKKKGKYEVLNCQSHHHHVILYNFNSFTIPLGGPFWLLGWTNFTGLGPAHGLMPLAVVSANESAGIWRRTNWRENEHAHLDH